jgi:hypothetical protein
VTTKTPFQTAAQRAKTTTFVVKGPQYFVARTTMPGVRVGIVGGTCFDIPCGHAYYDRCTEITNEHDAEAMFDELSAALN